MIILYNYFDGPIKLFSDLNLAKILHTFVFFLYTYDAFTDGQTFDGWIFMRIIVTCTLSRKSIE